MKKQLRKIIIYLYYKFNCDWHDDKLQKDRKKVKTEFINKLQGFKAWIKVSGDLESWRMQIKTIIENIDYYTEQLKRRYY